MYKTLQVSIVTLLAAAPAFAQFEGVMEMKMSLTDKEGSSQGGGTMTVAIAKAGTRNEINMQGPMPIKMVMLQKSSEPDKLYQINAATRSYAEIDLAKMREMAGQRPSEATYTVEKLGEEKILGYKTQHVLVKQKAAAGEAGPTMEMWNAKDFLDYETYNKLNARQAKMAGQENLIKALKAAGADGMPMKSVVSTEDGGKATMEVVKAEKKPLPAATFEIPEGYTKSEGGMMGGMSGPQTEEAKKRMEEALKNMTPEQREMIEKMMKQRRGNNP